METPIFARVVKGAAYLDTVRPGWEDEIDLDTLDMADGSCCVLGELYDDEVPRDEREYINGYDWALQKFKWSGEESREHGFTLHFPAGSDHWAALQGLWHELIAARLAAKDEDRDG